MLDAIWNIKKLNWDLPLEVFDNGISRIYIGIFHWKYLKLEKQKTLGRI